MTKKDYIALVNEFGLTYDADTTSAYYNEFPICGYRPCRSDFADWSARSLIIFGNYTDYLNEDGLYTGFYNDKYATKVEDARPLIANQIMVVKNKFTNERLEKNGNGFLMKKKEIFNICDQLGITYQAQPGLNETLFYKDFYVGSIDKFGNKYSIYMSHVPKEIDEGGLLETKDKIIAALNFKIKSVKEYETRRRQIDMEKDFE